MAADPSRLKQQLQNTGVQNKDTPMYQFLRALIDSIQAQYNVQRSGGGIPVGPIPPNLSNQPFITHQDAVVALPNSRELLAGTNVAFDDSIPNERTISAIGSAPAPDTATYLTKNNEVLNLPNSVQVLAGAGISFDDSVPNQRTISAAIPATAGAHAYRNSSLTLTLGVATVIPFTHELIDDDNYWNIAQPTRITIPETGWYAINGQTEIVATANLTLNLTLRKNGITAIAINDGVPQGVNSAEQVTSLIHLDAGDYIELIVLYGGAPGTQDLIGGTFVTYLQISNLTAGGGGGSSQYYEWDVLTNGDSENPEVIFADGDVVMIRVP